MFSVEASSSKASKFLSFDDGNDYTSTYIDRMNSRGRAAARACQPPSPKNPVNKVNFFDVRKKKEALTLDDVRTIYLHLKLKNSCETIAAMFNFDLEDVIAVKLSRSKVNQKIKKEVFSSK